MAARACPRCGADLSAEARFCSSCGFAIHTEDRADERRLVTVLFADVTGSTQLGERLDPEHLREVMASYFAAMREEIEAEGGTVEKFIGDAVMAVFGVPAVHEDDPIRALRAALRMRERLDDVNDQLMAARGVTLQIRIGVNTGEVLASVDPQPGDPMVTGDAVNVASRLQAAAEPGGILASERTARAARGFRFGELRGLDLKGKGQLVRAGELLESSPAVQRRGVPGLHAPMVGRDEELSLLRTMFRRTATEGRPNLVTLYGDAGVGKSRLTSEFVLRAEREGAAVVRGRCLPYGEGITYWPLAEILKGFAGVLDSDAPGLALEKIRKAGHELLTGEVTSDPGRATAALAYTMNVADPEFDLGTMEPREVRQEVHAGWRSFFSALAAEAPLVVIVEDIHWADPALLDLLDESAERVVGPVLFVCPSRPDLTATRPAWGGGRRNHSSIALDPLTPEQADQLVHELLTIDDLPPSVHARILERAEGNPFFLEEIVRQLIDEGHLVHEGDRWRALDEIEQVVIPDTVQAVLAARFDLLDAHDKRVLQAAAVVGRVFWPGPVALLAHLPDEAVDAALRTLEERELVVSRLTSSLAGQQELIFKHVLIRDVAYESLPRRERTDAHAAVAGWIEETAGDRAGEMSELLAYHLSTAVALSRDAPDGPTEKLRLDAFRWLLRASDGARRRLVVRKAQRLAEEALELAADELERTDALELLAEAFQIDYAGDLAWRYFREAAFLRASAEPPDGGRVARLAALGCEVAVRWPGSMRGEPPSEEAVRELWELGMTHLPPGDSEERIRLFGVRAGWAFAFPGGYDEEQLAELSDAALEGASIALRMGLPNRASAAYDQAIGPWISHGRYGLALPIWEMRSQIASSVTDVLEIGDLYAMGAWVHHEVGRYGRALELADTGLEAITGRHPTTELHIRAWRMAALYRSGRWDEALGEFGVVREMLGDRRDDPPYFASHAFAIAGVILHRRGERVQSDEVAGSMLRMVSESFGRLYGNLLRFLVIRGDLTLANELRRPRTWQTHAGDALTAEAERLAANADWAGAADLVATMRAHAEAGDAPSVASFADRLQGRAEAAGGELEAAAASLRRAAAGFDALGDPWEQALTDLDLARALWSTGEDEASMRLRDATETFESLRDVEGQAEARALSGGSG
ncbi:MAG TPA: adenylate/guanylate cyclase domain-containing protein [Actinomycetota bacterium]|nr:adenylate/guanylate cyclase domain-containing protein [Actinomycetota bacterium]